MIALNLDVNILFTFTFYTYLKVRLYRSAIRDNFFIYNPGHNILALFNNLTDVLIPTSKTILDI